MGLMDWVTTSTWRMRALNAGLDAVLLGLTVWWARWVLSMDGATVADWSLVCSGLVVVALAVVHLWVVEFAPPWLVRWSGLPDHVLNGVVWLESVVGRVRTFHYVWVAVASFLPAVMWIGSLSSQNPDLAGLIFFHRYSGRLGLLPSVLSGFSFGFLGSASLGDDVAYCGGSAYPCLSDVVDRHVSLVGVAANVRDKRISVAMAPAFEG